MLWGNVTLVKVCRFCSVHPKNLSHLSISGPNDLVCVLAMKLNLFIHLIFLKRPEDFLKSTVKWTTRDPCLVERESDSIYLRASSPGFVENHHLNVI